MPEIIVETHILAPIERVFDLARDIDLHVKSTAKTSESAIAGVTSGLIGLGEEVTWRAKHFGVWQTLTVRITAFDPPTQFTDTMQKGAFKSLQHQHYFEATETGTLMRDVMVFESPFGVIGQLFDALVLKRYMTRLLVERNRVIKQVAETG